MVGDVLVFVEDCGLDSCFPRVFHPHYPLPVMLKSRVKDVSFAEMLRKCSSRLWLVVYQRLHYDWYKRCRILIVWPVYMGVR